MSQNAALKVSGKLNSLNNGLFAGWLLDYIVRELHSKMWLIGTTCVGKGYLCFFDRLGPMLYKNTWWSIQLGSFHMLQALYSGNVLYLGRN